MVLRMNSIKFFWDPISERGTGTPGLSGLRDSSEQQLNQAVTIDQSDPLNGTSLLPNDVTLEQLQPPMIPDSLKALSQYLWNMRHEFDGIVRSYGNNSAAGIPGCEVATRYSVPETWPIKE